MWCYRLVAPYTFERIDVPEASSESLSAGQVLLRFLAAGDVPTLFTGTDPEDGSSPTNLTGRTVTLTPATNGTLYYNGNPITATTVIPT